MNNNKKNSWRQGDVLIVRVDKVPDGLVKTKAVTLALGEATGHHHTIHRGAIGYGQAEHGLAQYFEVTEESAPLVHQEHDPIPFEKGTYKAIRQVEYAPGELRNVAD